jgi:hypothetical protein
MTTIATGMVNELTEFPFLTIMSKCLDAFVPVYSLLVLYIIWNHHRNVQQKANQTYNYVLKKAIPEGLNGKKDWKATMCGRFNQGEAEGLDRWLIFLRKSYAARIIAPTLFFKLNNNLQITDNIFDVTSDFGNSGIPSKAPSLHMEIGTSEAAAKPIQAKDKDGVLCEYRCWINEGEEALYVSFDPVDKSGAFLKTWHIRRVLDPDLVEMVSLDQAHHLRTNFLLRNGRVSGVIPARKLR